MPRVTLFIVILIVLLISPSAAQLPRELAVMLSATVVGGPTPSITLHWDLDPNGKQITISKKLKSEYSWPTGADIMLDSTVTQWTDTNVEVGAAYDYRVLRYVYRQVDTDSMGKPLFGAWFGTGYISTGILVLPDLRTRTLLLVDSTMLAPLQQQLNTLRGDLESEGWSVTTIAVPRAEGFDAAKVERVRTLIKDAHVSGGNDIGAIFLIGRVPVLYSGAIAPDGHGDHVGAWPADGIYGDIDGTYSDITVNSPNTSRPTQNNIPGDGKYDPSRFTSEIDIPVGRVDFFNMPEFTEATTNPISEIDLVKNYLTRNHAYRTSSPSIRGGGIIDDNFKGYADVFSASAWRSFSVFASDTAVREADFFTTLAAPPTYLMAYGCGGGNDVSAGGIGSTKDMVTKPVNAVFVFLFGSYFGDWDTRNNFLRSALASKPTALTCAWSGRPHWYLYHMGLGESIGYSTRISQNALVQYGFYPALYFDEAARLYSYSFFDRMVHVALLGDPTLRAFMKPVARVTTVTASTEYPNKIKLSWLRPSGDADAYLVFRRRGVSKKFLQLTPRPITETSYADSTRYEGNMEYMVQAVALRSSASGTFYDYGKGAISVVTTTSVTEATPGDLRPTTLVAAPNPAQSDVSFIVILDATRGVITTTTLGVYDVTGRLVWSFEQSNLLPGQHTIGMNASILANGRYIVRLTTDGTTTTTQLTVAR